MKMMATNPLKIKTYKKSKRVSRFQNNGQDKNNQGCINNEMYPSHDATISGKTNAHSSLNRVFIDNNELRKYKNDKRKRNMSIYCAGLDNSGMYSYNNNASINLQDEIIGTKIKEEIEVQIRCDNNDKTGVSIYSTNHTNHIEVEDSDEELRCPKCRITYMSKMSIKNHIQVCKVGSKPLDSQEDKRDNNKTLAQRHSLNGIRKLNEDEKKSLNILEQSCFNNIDQISYDMKSEAKDGSSTPDETTYECEECDQKFYNKTKFARHCYAHTFIKIGIFIHINLNRMAQCIINTYNFLSFCIC